MENPVAGIFKIMQAEGAKLNPPSLSLGEVMTPYPDMTIKVGDILLTKEELRVADYLITSYERKVNLEGTLIGKTNAIGGGSGDATFASHNHTISDTASFSGKMIWTDTVTKGDEVLLLPSNDGNTYYVLCKVI